MAANNMAALSLVLGLCLHTGTFAQLPPEVLRTLADHGDRMYFMEKTVNQLQAHVTDLTNKLDVLVADKDHSTTHIKLQDSSNPTCCNCCTEQTSTKSPTIQSTSTTTARPTTSGLTTSTRTLTSILATLAPSATPVTIRAVPTCGWTPWINRDTPSDGIEAEHLTSGEIKQFCPNGNMTAISCATGNGLPAYFSGETFTCDLETGLLCKNVDNALVPCSDYTVRYYCDCGAAIAPADEASDDTQFSTTCGTSHWTPWINRATPDLSARDPNEYEQLTAAELAHHCYNGRIDAIECYTVDGISFYSTGDEVTCSLCDGLICYNRPILKKFHDYKIRYFCNCTIH